VQTIPKSQDIRRAEIKIHADDENHLEICGVFEKPLGEAGVASEEDQDIPRKSSGSE
jgi:hypothetical protein